MIWTGRVGRIEEKRSLYAFDYGSWRKETTWEN